MQLTKKWSLSACTLMASVLAGCGPEQVAHPSTVPAAGVVTYNGAAVSGATVVLMSEASKKGGWTCSGQTDAEGKFSITTIFAPGTDGKGIPEGEYTAIVQKFEAAGTAGAPKDLKSYAEEMKAKMPNSAAGIPQSEKASPKYVVPAKYSQEASSDLRVKIEKAGNSNIELKLTD